MIVKLLLKALLGLASYGFDSLLLLSFRLLRVTRQPSTLMIVRVDRIGDFVLWFPFAHRLVQAYGERGCRVVMIVGTDCAELARNVEGVDEVWPVDRMAFRVNPFYRAAFLNRVRRFGAEEAIQPAYSRIPSLGDAIIRLTGARRRLAWKGDSANATRLEVCLGNRAYTDLLSNPTDEISELLRNERLLERLGIDAVPTAPVTLPRRPLTAPPLPARYFVMALGASQGLKQWPTDRFGHIADRIHRETGWTGVVCGGRGDRPLAADMARAAQIPVVDLTGHTSLAELTDVIARAELLVSNDTAAVHIAAAVGTPSVCVAGGGQYGRFVPYPVSRLAAYAPPRLVVHPLPCFGCDWNCRYRLTGRQPAPCVASVTTQAVWTEVALGIKDADKGRLP